MVTLAPLFLCKEGPFDMCLSLDYNKTRALERRPKDENRKPVKISH
ncbi:hypothetical protein SAMN05421677_12741 [Halobacillus aidingensis]|uniref:Uncharacterized protein n=1 Tax=Halobacillus aidingensis TaxID=240303 RepID=A0A1H0UP02_HALAD|nr:hypothetical protein SAMN05421677_12741 [Halobacillus aidingensis]